MNFYFEENPRSCVVLPPLVLGSIRLRIVLLDLVLTELAELEITIFQLREWNAREHETFLCARLRFRDNCGEPRRPLPRAQVWVNS